MLTEHGEALVGVDPAPARRRNRRRPLEGQPGGVREQMPHGRAGRPGRLVEVDDALLGGDERRERADGLRHRGERNGAERVAAGRDRAVGAGDAGRRERDVPAVDLAQSLQRGAILPGHGAPPDLGPLAVRSRCRLLAGGRRGLDRARRRHRADPARRLADARKRLRAGAALPGDHRRGARARGLVGRRRRTHADVHHRSRALAGRVARPRRGLRRDVRPAATCVVTSLLDPSWKVEIEAEAVIG